MSRHVTLERINSSDKVAIYSVLYDGEAQNEFEKFIDEFGSKEEFKDDLGVILARIQKVENDSAADRHFRYEGTKRDRVMALPSHLETTSLRLYLLNIQAKILILGNGGVKTTRTYEEDETLSGYVMDLQQFDELLKQAQKNGSITIEKNMIVGIENKVFEL